jgi:hypothetical protein
LSENPKRTDLSVGAAHDHEAFGLTFLDGMLGAFCLLRHPFVQITVYFINIDESISIQLGFVFEAFQKIKGEKSMPELIRFLADLIGITGTQNDPSFSRLSDLKRRQKGLRVCPTPVWSGRPHPRCNSYPQ